MNGIVKSYILVKVIWFKGFDDLIRYYFGKLVEVWY